MTRIVGIGGKLASGKDAIADNLVDEWGWTKFGMSDALANALYTLDPWIPIPVKRVLRFGTVYTNQKFERYSDLFDRVGYVQAKENEEVRRLLQILGTEVGRRQFSDGDLWTGIMERKVRDATAAGAPGVIITGVRFPNELAMVENLGGESWWVNRPSLTNTSSTAGHASENSVSAVDFDLTIENDGTLEDLYYKVADLVT